MSERAAGILMPISSLPSEYGIGCFSKSAYEFVELAKKKQDRVTGRFCRLVLQATEILHISRFQHLRAIHISSVWRHWWKKAF